MKKLFSLFLLMVISMSVFACQPVPPQATVPPPQATATLPPTQTPAPTATQTLTPTPTPIAYSADQLAAMSEDEQLAACSIGLSELLKGVSIDRIEIRGTQCWAYTTKPRMNKEGEVVDTEVVAGVLEITTGEFALGVTYDQLVDDNNRESSVFAEMRENGKKVVFNGEIVHWTTLAEGPLFDAMNVEMNEQMVGSGPVEVLVTEEGEVVAVKWYYVPTVTDESASDWMSVARVEGLNGQSGIVLQPLVTGGKINSDNMPPAKFNEMIKQAKYLGRNEQKNLVMNTVVDLGDTTFIMVTGVLEHYPDEAGWMGVDNNVSPFNANGKNQTADPRSGNVIVCSSIAPIANLNLAKTIYFYSKLNWKGTGSVIASPVSAAWMPYGESVVEDWYIELYSFIVETAYKNGLIWDIFH